MSRKCGTIIVQALRWSETDSLEEVFLYGALPLNLQASELGSQHRADVMESGSNQLIMLPLCSLEARVCPFCNKYKSRVSISSPNFY